MSLAVSLLPAARALALDLLAGPPFQTGASWWRAVCDACIPEGGSPSFVVVTSNGAPVFVLPLLTTAHRVSGLTTPYTCLYQPRAVADAPLAAIGELIAPQLGPVCRLDALDRGWPGWAPLLEGLARAGRRHAWFDGFEAWREPIGGRSWNAYLADRPGALRETIRRRLRRAERDASIEIVVGSEPGEAGRLLAEYEQVHARSWKAAEPYPRFARAFVAEAATAGALRIAVLRQSGFPLAAQYWTVEAGSATVHKLAHDEAARASSPGTVLTAWMMRRLIDIEGIELLDFGRGGDAYKQLWAGRMERRDGLVIATPWHPAGAAALLRQAAACMRRRLITMRTKAPRSFRDAQAR